MHEEYAGPHVLNKYMVDCGRLIALVAPIFYISLYPCFLIVPSHTYLGPGHMTFFGQRVVTNLMQTEAWKGICVDLISLLDPVTIREQV